MIFSKNRPRIQSIIFLSFVLGVALIAYSPLLSNVLLAFLLPFLLFVRKKRDFTFLFFILTLYIFSFSVLDLSLPSYQYAEQDFSSYYNNYLLVLNGEYSSAFTRFAGGFEFGLPLFHFFLSLSGSSSYEFLNYSYIISIYIGVVFLIYKIYRKLELSVHEFIVLIVCTFVFLKTPTIINHLRQGYSSIFLLCALFSLTARGRLFFLSIATVFHSSAIVIFPLIFVLTKITKDNFKIVISLILFSFFLLGLSMQFIINYIDYNSYFVLGKLLVAADLYRDADLINHYLFRGLTYAIYLLPLVVLGLFRYRPGRFSNDYYYMMVTLFIIQCVISFVPIVGTRLFESIFSIMVGFYYFTIIYSFKNTFHFFILLIVFSLVLVAFRLVHPFSYSAFPGFNSDPFLFYNNYFNDNGFINRDALPSIKNIKE